MGGFFLSFFSFFLRGEGFRNLKNKGNKSQFIWLLRLCVTYISLYSQYGECIVSYYDIKLRVFDPNNGVIM